MWTQLLVQTQERRAWPEAEPAASPPTFLALARLSAAFHSRAAPPLFPGPGRSTADQDLSRSGSGPGLAEGGGDRPAERDECSQPAPGGGDPDPGLSRVLELVPGA